MPVSEQVILVTSLMNGCDKEELIIEIVKNIDREAWLQRQNKVLTTIVYGLCDRKISNFQKCVTFQHLYSLADSDKFVLPFSFLVNLLFTVTNSKLALSVVIKTLPGGSYFTSDWLDRSAGICSTAIPCRWLCCCIWQWPNCPAQVESRSGPIQVSIRSQPPQPLDQEGTENISSQ